MVSATPQESVSFAQRLLSWWGQHGRHELPWQCEHRSAYHLWIAEIMLQQTQVTTVIPYYQRFLESFPDLPALAAASLDEVLALWSGLGYYQRARNLHACAQRCVERHDSRLPVHSEQLLELPGIGPSTANAILSQATDQVLPILDGNVKRVMARHAGIAGWPGTTAVSKQLWQAVEQRLPATRGADYTQASMDLGALVCTRSFPDCDSCPVSNDCYALQQQQIELLPGKKPKREKPSKAINMLLVRDANDRILLYKRPSTGVWGGLWSLPESDPPEQAVAAPVIRHQLSHYTMLLTPWHCAAEDLPGQDCQIHDSDSQWFTIRQALASGLPQPVRKLLEEIQ